jgi:hypothetical protein
MRLRLAIETERDVRAVGLSVQVRIAAERRRYDDVEAQRLIELFGQPSEWARSLGGIPWIHASHNIGPLEQSTSVDVLLPCSYDFDVAASKYLAALEIGDIPVDVLFSGNVFYNDADGRLKTVRIPWDREVAFRIPVSVWRAAVDAAFPGTAWVRVSRATFERLHAFRSRNGLTEWDQTFEALLSPVP